MDDSQDEQCLDLSLKEFWVIIHYQDCDPGNEFDILHEKQLIGDSWETLERGAQVMVSFGNARVQGLVVLVSDDLSYLQKNFISITEEFLMVVDSPKKCRSAQNKEFEYRGLQRTVIKVKDKAIQTEIATEANEKYENLKQENESLKAKYENLKNIFDGFKSTLRAALHKADAGEVGECSKSVEVKKENILRPINRVENKSQKSNTSKETELQIEEDEQMVYIGSNKTPVPKEMYDSVNWLSYSAATRKLLITVFQRKVLATHSLTGKPSPAFIGADKQTKMRLEPTKISDIVEVVSKKCHVSESMVRSAITTKCADENKMYRKRMEKKVKQENMENTDSNSKKFKYM